MPFSARWRKRGKGKTLMAESFTSTYTCDGCGKAITVGGIADCPPFWLAVSFRNADPDGTQPGDLFTSHYCCVACVLESVGRFAAGHVDEDWAQ